jgi:hypothetical protein
LEKITENCNCYGLHHVFGISVEDLHNMLKELKFASNRGYEKSFNTQIQEMLGDDELMIEFPGVQALMEEEVHFQHPLSRASDRSSVDQQIQQLEER